MAESRAEKIVRILSKEYSVPRTALRYSNPLEILIATILSAQCTDERVNKVTKELFKKYRSIEDYAKANLEELEQDIRSTGFYKNKARNIKNCCQLLEEKFNGTVPQTMKELTSLPGVARKTANVVLQNAYGVVEGIVVDTHVKRLSQRLNFTRENNPEKIEQDLMKLIPKESWMPFSFLLVFHGRKICRARKPKCKGCMINELCPSAFKVTF